MFATERDYGPFGSARRTPPFKGDTVKNRVGLVRTLLFVLLTLPLGAAQARAAAITLIEPGVEYGSGLYTLGFEFTVLSPYTVRSLGVYDSQMDGLANDANVAIWLNTGGAPLASTVVPDGTGGDLEGFFRYAEIAPFVLMPETTYVIGAYLPGDLASSLNTGQGGSGTVDPNVLIVRDRFSNFDSAFGFPTASNDHVGGAWLGANFRSEAVTAVPEPATLTLLGLGLVGARAARRRKL
jgi:hypothetical protein